MVGSVNLFPSGRQFLGSSAVASQRRHDARIVA